MSNDRLLLARRGSGSGVAFVVTGPSGAGKTSVINRVMEQLPNLVFSVSHTTRSKREQEVDGAAYVFVTEDEFAGLVDAGEFVEHTIYSGARYGTTRTQLEAGFRCGNDVILNVEVEGAKSLRRTGFGEHPIVYVFLAPSTLARLAERLRARGTEIEAKIDERIAVAAHEMEETGSFDYLVINDSLDEAVDELRSIIIAERLRIANR